MDRREAPISLGASGHALRGGRMRDSGGSVIPAATTAGGPQSVNALAAYAHGLSSKLPHCSAIARAMPAYVRLRSFQRSPLGDMR